MAGDAVLNRFQSSRVKSIFRVMGARGGAAKLNQTIFNSITHDETRPLLFDTAMMPLFDPLPDGGCGLLVTSLSSWSFDLSENLLFVSGIGIVETESSEKLFQIVRTFTVSILILCLFTFRFGGG